MSMKSWDEIEKDRLEFPIAGKTYVIPELPYQSMLTLEKAKAGESTYLDDAPPEETWRIVMGDVYDDMKADNVPGEALARAALATLAFFEFGRDIAEAVWETGIDPKALDEAIRAQTGREGSKPSPSTAAASSTRKRASSSGTTSRRATKRASSSTKAAPKGR